MVDRPKAKTTPSALLDKTVPVPVPRGGTLSGRDLGSDDADLRDDGAITEAMVAAPAGGAFNAPRTVPAPVVTAADSASGPSFDAELANNRGPAPRPARTSARAFVLPEPPKDHAHDVAADERGTHDQVFSSAPRARPRVSSTLATALLPAPTSDIALGEMPNPTHAFDVGTVVPAQFAMHDGDLDVARADACDSGLPSLSMVTNLPQQAEHWQTNEPIDALAPTLPPPSTLDAVAPSTQQHAAATQTQPSPTPSALEVLHTPAYSQPNAQQAIANDVTRIKTMPGRDDDDVTAQTPRRGPRALIVGVVLMMLVATATATAVVHVRTRSPAAALAALVQPGSATPRVAAPIVSAPIVSGTIDHEPLVSASADAPTLSRSTPPLGTRADAVVLTPDDTDKDPTAKGNPAVRAAFFRGVAAAREGHAADQFRGDVRSVRVVDSGVMVDCAAVVLDATQTRRATVQATGVASGKDAVLRAANACGSNMQAELSAAFRHVAADPPAH